MGRETSETIIELERRVMGQTFKRYPVVFDHASGVQLWDTAGREYLDFFSGHAVMNLGYGHSGQQSAMLSQMQRLVHMGNLFYLEPQIRLAESLTENSFADRVFFTNSGAEIVELAVKLARKWSKQQGLGVERHELISLERSFHGRTYGALSATGQPKYHQDFAPMLPGFAHVPANDLAALRSAITPQTCAILLEPVQGEGGIRPAGETYLQEVRALCDQHQLLLIFDEIQCGLGRLGRRFAYEHFNVTPDVLLLGKPLGGGLPLAALLTREGIAACLQVGDHGSTFGGNPVAAAGGLVLMQELERPGFLDRVRRLGEHLGQGLTALKKQFPQRVAEVRGIGLMWGLELRENGQRWVELCLERGLIINCTSGNVLRCLPALTITGEEIDHALNILRSVFMEIQEG